MRLEEATGLRLEELYEACRQMPSWSRKRASAFNAILRHELEKKGWIVRDEVLVSNRGDGRRGRIDLVVEYPQKFVIEVDRKTARKKSLYKMAQLADYLPVSILREKADAYTKDPA